MAERHQKSKAETVSSRETGLAITHILGRTLFGFEHLHYGYWTDDLRLEVGNLGAAQERYTRELIGAIPSGVETVLDVGCGPATNAVRLAEAGFEVECVQPPGPLADLARERLGDRAKLHEVFFQDFETPRRYDLILFSESLLFIRPLSLALSKAASLLADGGFLLICDIFRKPEPSAAEEASGKYHSGPIGGGHYFADFEQVMASQPFRLVEDADISAQIAPTFDLVEDVIHDLTPAYDLLMAKLTARRPWTTRLLRRVLKLDKYEKKHLYRSDRNARTFLETKLYRRLLYQLKQPGA